MKSLPVASPGSARVAGLLSRGPVWLRPTVVVGLAYLAVLALYPLVAGYTGLLDFVHIGQYYCCKVPTGTFGYDGQFYYYLARDPFHGSVYLDNAPFRMERMLFSVAVWVLSLGGQAGLVPFWLLALNVIGTLAGTAGLAVLLKRHELSPWFSLAFGLFLGQFASITHDVPDGLAAALIVFAFLAADRGRWIEATIWLAVAALTRETVVVFAVGMALDAAFKREWKRALLLLSSALPLLAWLIALRFIFGASGLFFSSVVSKAPKIPFAGLVGIAGASPRFVITLIVITLPLLLAVVWGLRELWRGTWKASPGLLFALGVNLGLAIFLNAFTYQDLASSARITIGIPLAWMLYAIIRQSRLLLWLAVPWAAGVFIYALAVLIHLQSIII
ncbi:MAG TPA: hypothetical protein VH540_18570 [Ktedonobacterales bacterium]